MRRQIVMLALAGASMAAQAGESTVASACPA